MFDKVVFYLRQPYINNFGEDAEIEFNGITLKKNHRNKAGQVYYKNHYDTFHISLYADRVYISSSLPANIHEHNATDLNYNETKKVIKEICNWLQCTPEKLLVKSFEFGFTVPLSIKVDLILKRLMSHKNKMPLLTLSKGRLIEVKFYHEDYNLKAYNKRIVELRKRGNGAKMHGEWLRIEMQFSKGKIQEVVSSAADLMSRANIHFIFKELMTQWGHVIKLPSFDPNQYSEAKRNEVFAKTNVLYYENLVEYKTKAAVSKIRQRFYKELKTMGDYTTHNEIDQQLNKKFKLLIENQNIPYSDSFLLIGKQDKIVLRYNKENAEQDEYMSESNKHDPMWSKTAKAAYVWLIDRERYNRELWQDYKSAKQIAG